MTKAAHSTFSYFIKKFCQESIEIYFASPAPERETTLNICNLMMVFIVFMIGLQNLYCDSTS